MKTKSLLMALAGLVMAIWIGTVAFATPFDPVGLFLTIGFGAILFTVLIFAPRRASSQ